MKKVLTVLCGAFVFSMLTMSVSAHDEVAAIAVKNKAKAERIAAKNAAKEARLENARTNDAKRIAEVEARRAAKITAANLRKSGKSHANVVISDSCSDVVAGCSSSSCH